MLNAAGDPITKASQTTLVNSPDQVALHTYGASFKTNWVTSTTPPSTATLRSRPTR